MSRNSPAPVIQKVHSHQRSTNAHKDVKKKKKVLINGGLQTEIKKCGFSAKLCARPALQAKFLGWALQELIIRHDSLKVIEVVVIGNVHELEQSAVLSQLPGADAVLCAEARLQEPQAVLHNLHDDELIRHHQQLLHISLIRQARDFKDGPVHGRPALKKSSSKQNGQSRGLNFIPFKIVNDGFCDNNTKPIRSDDEPVQWPTLTYHVTPVLHLSVKKNVMRGEKQALMSSSG